ncbi:MFS transporter [Candidatus Bathyarchaeota archaeon]|nr:MFS transporter [Candidatus Bathyarchaeota archaeon]
MFSKSDIRSLMHGNFLVVTLMLAWIRFWGALYEPYMSIYFIDIGGTYFQLGALLAFSLLARALISIPGGYICDQYGRKKILVIGSYFWVIGRFLVFLASDWQSFFIAYVFFMGIAMFGVAAQQAIFMDSLPQGKRGLGFALNGMILALVGLVAPTIGGWIYASYGLFGVKVVLFACMIAELIKAIIYTFFLKESLVNRVNVEKMGLTILLKRVVQSFKSIPETFKWMPKPLLGFCITNLVFCFGAAFTGTYFILGDMTKGLIGQTGSFFVLYAVDVIFLTTIQWGLINTINIGVSVVLMMPSGSLTDRYGRNKLIVIFLGVTSVLVTVFLFCRTFPQVLAVITVSCIVGTLVTPAWNAIQLDYSPPEMRGKVFSILQLLTAIASFFSFLIGGYLYSLNFMLPFLLYTFFSLLATAVAFLMLRK